MSPIVSDFRTLKGMERQGFIICNGRPRSRERHWTGRYVRVITVQEGPKLTNWYDVFTYRGKDYRIRYFDGCFKPFVIRLDSALRLPYFV